MEFFCELHQMSPTLQLHLVLQTMDPENRVSFYKMVGPVYFKNVYTSSCLGYTFYEEYIRSQTFEWYRVCQVFKILNEEVEGYI